MKKMKCFVLILLFLIGLFFSFELFNYNRSFLVENKQIVNENIIQNIKIYKPKKDGKYPAIIFGAGSGADKALYHYYASSFAKNDFIVLLRNTSYGYEKVKTWKDSTKDYINCFEFLKSLNYVDKSNILIGGHSANANITYRVSQKLNDEIKGVIAIAGRFPPDDFKQKTNIFLATGKKDKIVNPNKIISIAKKIQNRPINAQEITGDFNNKTAIYLYLDNKSNHFTEIWSKDIINNSLKFAFYSVNKDLKNIKLVEDFSYFDPIIFLLFGISLIFLTIKLYNHKKIYFKNPTYNHFFIIIISIIIFITMKISISQNFIDLGPYFFNIKRYFLVLIISIITFLIFKYILKFKKQKIIYDFIYIFTTIFIYFIVLKLMIYIPSFYAGGSLIIFKTIILLIPLFFITILLYKNKLIHRKIVYILYLIWILPIILPSSLLI